MRGDWLELANQLIRN